MSSPPAAKAPDTPPSSDIEPDTHRLPPSPPLSPKRAHSSSVDRVFSIQRLRKAGLYQGDSDWRAFRLSASEHVELERRLQADDDLWAWYCDKVRYDFDSGEERYTLRMPSGVHEFFVASVDQAITSGIRGLADRLDASGDAGKEQVVTHLREIRGGRSAIVELHVPQLENSSQDTTSSACGEDVIVPRSPDASYYHAHDRKIPTMVVEVSYSQQRKEMLRLAESYIVDSRHEIRCVIGLDIPYKRQRVTGKAKKSGQVTQEGEMATVSVWRPDTQIEDGEEVGVCRVDVDAVPFRSADNETCTGALELTVADILPTSTLAALPASATHETISIPFADLTSFLAHAEQSGKQLTQPTSAPKKFRKRKRTPSEELSDAREQTYTQQEAAELEREKAVDGEWRARSRRRTGGDVDVEVVERRRNVRKRAEG